MDQILKDVFDFVVAVSLVALNLSIVYDKIYNGNDPSNLAIYVGLLFTIRIFITKKEKEINP